MNIYQAELDAEAQEFRMETPVQTRVDNDCTEYVTTGRDTQEFTQTAQSVDLPSTQELEPSDTQPRRSRRERRPRETLTYESLGQPTHCVVVVFLLDTTTEKTVIGSLWTDAEYSVNNGHSNMDCL